MLEIHHFQTMLLIGVSKSELSLLTACQIENLEGYIRSFWAPQADHENVNGASLTARAFSIKCYWTFLALNIWPRWFGFLFLLWVKNRPLSRLSGFLIVENVLRLSLIVTPPEKAKGAELFHSKLLIPLRVELHHLHHAWNEALY